jgi:hypothetical protein
VAAGRKPKELSGRFGIAAKTISNRASAEGWKVDREEVGKILAHSLPSEIAARLVTTAADYVQQHTDDWQELRRLMMAGLSEEADADTVRRAALAAEIAKSYKHVQTGQRLSLGLDKDKPPEPEGNQNGIVILPAKELADGHQDNP